MLVDSHCHLNYPALSKQCDAVIARAKAAGVVHILNACTTIKDFPEVLGSARAHKEVYCSIGVHPHHCTEKGEYVTAEDIIKLTKNPKVVAIGETGLDYFYDRSPRDEQQRNFREHIRATAMVDLPIIVHSREAEDDTLRLLLEGINNNGKLKGVMHCFSSKRELAQEALNLGFYISFSGILTFQKSEELRKIAYDVPLDRLLIETDSPYLAPEPFRGKLCEPAYIVHTAKMLAKIKGISFEQLAAQTTKNFFTLFSKVPHQ